MSDEIQIPLTTIHRISADGVNILYREAGPSDAPVAEVQFLDTGHFALETHLAEITSAMRTFFSRIGY